MFYHILLITYNFRSLFDHHRGSFTEVITEYSNMPNCICGTTQRYNECIKSSIWSQNVDLYTIKNR